MLANVDVILHRPQSSDNIGAVARAMRNCGLAQLVLVAPKKYDDARARVLAVHSEDVLERARFVDTLEEAIAPYALVIPTTERALPDREAPVTPREAAKQLLTIAQTGRAALLFGEEATGLPAGVLARFSTYSSIPSHPTRRSLNLAQACLLYGWELWQEEGGGAAPVARRAAPMPGEVPAPHQLMSLVRERSKKLLLASGFLNPQQPDRALDEFMRLLQRANPQQREVEMLLAAIDQLERTSAVAPQ